MSKEKKQVQIDALTGIRFFMMIAVLLGHIQMFMLKELFPFAKEWFYPLEHLWTIVDMFFILSGFIIALNYAEAFSGSKSGSYKKYILGRFARIFPVHIATTLMLVVGLVLIFGIEHWQDADGNWLSETYLPKLDVSIPELFKSLLLIQSWLLPTGIPWNIVSWSVSCEWLAYLIFPLIVSLISPLADKPVLLKSLFVLLYLTGLALIGISWKIFGASNAGVIRILTEFSFGIILYYLTQLNSANTQKPYPRALVWIGVIVVTASNVFVFSSLWIIPLFAWLIFVIVTGKIDTPLLSKKWAVYGGKITYSAYLCHGLVLILWLYCFPVSQYLYSAIEVKVLYVLAYVIVVAILSVVVFHGIEEPARKWLNKKLVY